MVHWLKDPIGAKCQPYPRKSEQLAGSIHFLNLGEAGREVIASAKSFLTMTRRGGRWVDVGAGSEKLVTHSDSNKIAVTNVRFLDSHGFQQECRQKYKFSALTSTVAEFLVFSTLFHRPGSCAALTIQDVFNTGFREAHEREAATET